MALFRLHRGDFIDSLKTTRIVKSISDIKYSLKNEFRSTIDSINIVPYPDKENNFDSSIGWYTHIVTGKISDGTNIVLGYLSENLKNSDIFNEPDQHLCTSCEHKKEENIILKQQAELFWESIKAFMEKNRR